MEKRIKKIADVSEDIANLKFSSEDIANIEKGAVQDVKNAIKYAEGYYENLSDGPEKIYDDDVVKTVEEYFEDYDAYNMDDAIEKAVAKYFPEIALYVTSIFFLIKFSEKIIIMRALVNSLVNLVMKDGQN